MSDVRKSPKPDAGQPTEKGRPQPGPMVIFTTALDTTWRIFVPTLGGTFLGIWIDSLLGSEPIAVIACLVLGTILTFILITHQVLHVRNR